VHALLFRGTVAQHLFPGVRCAGPSRVSAAGLLFVARRGLSLRPIPPRMQARDGRAADLRTPRKKQHSPFFLAARVSVISAARGPIACRAAMRGRLRGCGGGKPPQGAWLFIAFAFYNARALRGRMRAVQGWERRAGPRVGVEVAGHDVTAAWPGLFPAATAAHLDTTRQRKRLAARGCRPHCTARTEAFSG
jgi:hypothetical protein